MITVIKLRDLIKYAVCFILVLTLLIFGISNIVGKEELENTENNENIFSDIADSSFLYFLKLEMPIFTANEETTTKVNTNENGLELESILNTQLAIMYNLEEYQEIDDTNLENGESNLEVIEEERKLEEAKDNLNTEVIAEHNINASFTDEINGVKVNNQTGYDIKDTIQNANYNVTNKDKIIIYHTHTCESYTSSDAYPYQMTGVYRTTDLNYTVSRVGDELGNYLSQAGKTVVHDKTYHDYPAYNGSYGRSLKTVNKAIENNKDAEIVIDLHRDAIGDNTYGPTVKIGDEVCAQVMFVIGTNGSGLYHPNWRKNLEFAVTVQKKANELYPRTFQANNTS